MFWSSCAELKPFVSCKASPLHFFCSSAWRCCSGPATKLEGSGRCSRHPPNSRISATSFASLFHRYRSGWFLGNRITEYPGLYSLCTKSTRPDDWPGARSACNDDLLFFHWHCCNFGNPHHIRASAVGSGRGFVKTRKPVRSRNRHARTADGHTQCKCCGQCCFSSQ